MGFVTYCHIVSLRNSDAHALPQTYLGERVGVLAADEAADFADAFSLNDFQPSAVSRAPDQLLVERGNHLSMMVEDLTLVADKYGGIPDAAYAVPRPLVEADVGEDLVLGAYLPECLHLLAIDQQTLACQASEEAVVVDGRCYGGLQLSSIQPTPPTRYQTYP